MKQPLKSGLVMNCLVVDDEPVAREGILEYIRQIDYLNPVAQCKNAVEAAGLLRKHPIDLVFLDIQMPGLTGIEFIRALADPPMVIFITAYSGFALEGFELDMVDYLLKPVSFARFLKAVEKAVSVLQAKRKDFSITSEFFFIKCNSRIEKIIMADVVYVEAMSNYVIIHTAQKRYITYLTFSGMVEQLPADLFVRIHKSFLVAVSAIQSIGNTEVVTSLGTLALGRHYRNEVLERIRSLMMKR